MADDDIDDQELFGIALNEIDKGIECIYVNDGIEALSILTDEKQPLPDCIFLDLNMPKMDGKECLQQIRKQPRCRHIPVVIFSTSSDSSDNIATTALGAAAFITKPPRTADLVRLLKELFQSIHKTK
jgi:CheY-like chemotaxis protein